MNQPPDNRAVSPLFRVFGGEEVRVAADARETSNSRGMHLGEYRAFSVLIPLTLFVAIGAWLSSMLVTIAGWLLAIPIAILALNILPFVLFAKSPLTQWRMWSSLCLLWAIFHCRSAGLAGLFSYTWIAMMVMGVVADCILAFQELMAFPGKCGIVWRISAVILLHAAAIAVGFKFGWPWGIAGAAAIAAGLCWAVLNPYCQWLGPVYRTTSRDEILITIDDGPDPHDTPLLLDLLDRHETKAIFFMIGEKVRAHPEFAREVIRRGHDIGNHTLTHPAGSFWCASPWRTWREIAGGQQAIEETVGKKPRLFRAPVGHRNLFTHPVAKVLGLEVMAWNRRGYDAVEKDAGKVLARILPDLTNGDIVLLHEATPIAAEVLAGVLARAVKLSHGKITD
ncbi:MAG: polysaccharide deacetylase family protein [Luteolibacter sp.]|uniref:polysaccharide deacetylase family protein n=1 Tax=Luteolibacter sp. TaxID=1962973 RepID=UPI003264BF14